MAESQHYHQSFDSVLSNIAPGGTYEGWQFATQAQLSAMFLDYTGGITFYEDAGGPPMMKRFRNILKILRQPKQADF